MRALNHKIPPPLVAFLVATLMWTVSTWGPQLQINLLLKFAVVSILVSAGIAFDLAGIFVFRSSHTTINPLKPHRTSTLVSSGVYRWTRNPMYLGLALLLCAWTVYLSALVALIGPAVFVLYITKFQIGPEEDALRELFGEEYATYASQVRRWI